MKKEIPARITSAEIAMITAPLPLMPLLPAVEVVGAGATVGVGVLGTVPVCWGSPGLSGFPGGPARATAGADRASIAPATTAKRRALTSIGLR
jgi:hypothetical protein